MLPFYFRLAVLVLISFSHVIAEGIPGATCFVVIGCDGMSPSGIRKASTPVMHRLMQEGAFSLSARAVIPTVSSPNWASIIMGAGPEQHGVTSNEWETNRFEIAPIERGPGGIFPTIFGVMREQRPDSIIGVFHDWDGFARLLEPYAPNVIEHGTGPTNTMERAINFIRAKRPTFTFVHLDNVDHAGHEHGWGSAEYLSAVEVADKLIGRVLDALRDAGMMEHAVVLVTADHGGIGKKHGGMTMDEIEIPWILWGAGVAHGRELATHINTYDTAATIAYVFGLKAPECWIAKPVKEAFVATAETRTAH
jgi:predicted AlkP superfamily pyrophosphatase or phosphodiesterase